MAEKPRIVLDPGHGSTPGADGYDPGVVFGVRTEAEANLEAAFTLKYLLTQRGWDVRLTHDGTQGGKPDLAQRVKYAIQVEALAFISVHYDMAFTPPRHRRGVYHAPGTASFALAQHLQRALGPTAWIAPSSSSRFGGLYIDAFPDARPSVLLEIDSIEFAPAVKDRVGRLTLLRPVAVALDTLRLKTEI